MAITIRWYLSWAKQAQVPVDVDSARDFITQVELEKRPVPYRLEQWKEALRWFFREGKRRQKDGAGVVGPRQAGDDAGVSPRDEPPGSGSEKSVAWVKRPDFGAQAETPNVQRSTSNDCGSLNVESWKLNASFAAAEHTSTTGNSDRDYLP